MTSHHHQKAMEHRKTIEGAWVTTTRARWLPQARLRPGPLRTPSRRSEPRGTRPLSTEKDADENSPKYQNIENVSYIFRTIHRIHRIPVDCFHWFKTKVYGRFDSLTLALASSLLIVSAPALWRMQTIREPSTITLLMRFPET